MTFAVLGLGEAGGRYAADLAAAGVDVVGYDPGPVPTPAGVARVGSAVAAAAGAEVVVCLATAAHAVELAEQVAPSLRRDAVYADLNTAAPQLKRDVAAVVARAGARSADVAVLAPVPRAGLRTPLLVSGPGAAALAEALRPLGVPVEVLDGEAGAAAARKLLRGVFMKGLAAVVLEALAAGRAAGCESWVRSQIAEELEAAGPQLVDRLEHGSRLHAARRIHEMEATRAYLDELRVPHDASEAALRWLTRLCEADSSLEGAS